MGMQQVVHNASIYMEVSLFVQNSLIKIRVLPEHNEALPFEVEEWNTYAPRRQPLITRSFSRLARTLPNVISRSYVIVLVPILLLHII